MARIRQSRPDSGLGFTVKVLKPILSVLSSLGSGAVRAFVLSVFEDGPPSGHHRAIDTVLL